MKIKLLAAAAILSAALPAFAAPVNFSFIYTDAAGTGFNDATLGADR
jgi:hypothetical protein